MDRMDHQLVVHFIADNSYTVVDDELNKYKSAESIKIKYDKWYNGSIVYRGTKKQCQKYVDFKLKDAEFLPTDDDTDIEVPTATKSKITIQKISSRFSINNKDFNQNNNFWIFF